MTSLKNANFLPGSNFYHTFQIYLLLAAVFNILSFIYSLALAVVKLSACSPCTLTIRVRISLSLQFCTKKLFEKDEKQAGNGQLVIIITLFIDFQFTNL